MRASRLDSLAAVRAAYVSPGSGQQGLKGTEKVAEAVGAVGGVECSRNHRRQSAVVVENGKVQALK
jgi:hypothetical protein